MRTFLASTSDQLDWLFAQRRHGNNKHTIYSSIYKHTFRVIYISFLMNNQEFWFAHYATGTRSPSQSTLNWCSGLTQNQVFWRGHSSMESHTSKKTKHVDLNKLLWFPLHTHTCTRRNTPHCNVPHNLCTNAPEPRGLQGVCGSEAISCAWTLPPAVACCSQICEPQNQLPAPRLGQCQAGLAAAGPRGHISWSSPVVTEGTTRLVRILRLPVQGRLGLSDVG